MRLQSLGPLAQSLLLVVQLAALERQRALRRPSPAATAARPPRASAGAARDGERRGLRGRLERHRHPALVDALRASREDVHLVARERPDGLTRCDRPGEGHVGVEAERAPCLERLVVVARARDHLHRRASGAREDDEPGLGSDEAQQRAPGTCR